MNATDLRRDMIADFVVESLTRFDIDRARLTPEAPLEPLGVDSLDLAELAQAVRKQLAVPVRPQDLVGARTVGDVLDVLLGKARLG